MLHPPGVRTISTRMPFWFGKELPSRHNDDGAIDVRPQDALSDQEPLYSPLTWGPKSLSHDILIAKRLVKTFPTGDSTNSLVRALNKLSLDTDTIAEPIRANEFVIITGPGNAGYVPVLALFMVACTCTDQHPLVCADSSFMFHSSTVNLPCSKLSEASYPPTVGSLPSILAGTPSI